MTTILLYAVAIALLLLSWFQDKQKTRLSLKKAAKAFENILPLLLPILLLIGIALAVLSPAVISSLLGQQSGWAGILAAAVIGAVTLIPGFVTFPLAAALLKNGAGLTQVIVFISTSMMVGVVTMPMEILYFGRKTALIRNGLAFVFSFLAAFFLQEVLSW